MLSLFEIPPESLERPDSQSAVLYLEVPPANVVLLQAYFELYEGIGVVRTIDIASSRICILMAADMLQDCLDALESIREGTGWRFTSKGDTV